MNQPVAILLFPALHRDEVALPQVTGLVGYGMAHEVWLSWNEEPSATSYTVEARPQGVGSFEDVATIDTGALTSASAPTLLLTRLVKAAATSRRYCLLPLLHGVTYEFRVRASASSAEGPPSDAVALFVGFPGSQDLELGYLCQQGVVSTSFYNHAATDKTGAGGSTSIGDGVLANGPTWVATGLSFDGTDDAVNGNAGDEIAGGGTAATEYFLLNFASFVASKRIRKTTATARYELRTGAGQTIVVRAVLGSNFDLTLTGTVSLSTWYLIWFRRNGAELRGKLGTNAEASISTLPLTAESTNYMPSLGDAAASAFTLGAWIRVKAAVTDHTPYLNFLRGLALKRGITVQGL